MTDEPTDSNDRTREVDVDDHTPEVNADDHTPETDVNPADDRADLALPHINPTWKVLGEIDESGAMGVLGTNTATTGKSYGVVGHTDSRDSFAAGIYGKAAAETGSPTGVRGVTKSADDFTAGVEGVAQGSAGRTFGVKGSTVSTQNWAAGVRGHAAANSGKTYGVDGLTSSTGDFAAGVQGKATSDTGKITGVRGESQSSTFGAAGVKGSASAESGEVYGVRGTTRSPEGFGLYTPDDASVGGDLGVGTRSPRTRLHVVDSVSGSAGIDNHVAFVENTSSSGSADVLALKIDESGSNIDSGNNYVSFKDDSGPIGAIEGTGDGVTLTSGNADYAEYLPRLDPGEEIATADVVGVVGDAITRQTAEADQALVVSERSIVTGNSPGTGPGDREDYEPCAFVGQVPVKVRGPVEEGDVVVPSGEHDGTGRAIAPAEYRPGDGPIVGRAWEADDEEDVSQVTVAVGLETGDALASALARQQAAIENLEATVERKDERIGDLETENEALRERLRAVEDRLASLEAGRVSPTTADD